jgi:general secretion pathway protein B
MSFILDALKKLEQEKAARKGGDVKISDEIVRENRRGMRKARRSVPVSVVLVALGLVLLLGASGAFLWHKHGGGDQSKVAAVGPEQTLPAAPKMSEASQGTILAEPVVPEVRPMADEAAEPSPLPMEAKRTSRREWNEAKSLSRPDFKARPTQPSGEVSSSGGSGPKVSGIAWQDAPSARRAVINGDLVQEGAQVDGATVEEILPSRVLFSSGSRRFTVSISGPLVAK